MNQGMTRKSRLWSQTGERSLRELLLLPWARRRREDLFRVRVLLDEQLAPPDRAVAEAAPKDQKARLLMTQPGLGPITSIPFVLTIGDVSRFQPGKQVASYWGLTPREYSSGGKQRLGSISKRGNWFMGTLLVEAAQTAGRSDPQMRNEYLHRGHRKAKGVANVPYNTRAGTVGRPARCETRLSDSRRGIEPIEGAKAFVSSSMT